MNSAELYTEYKTKMQKIADVKYASAVLQWDQETYLPPNGNDFRGQQIATLSEIAHDQFTSEALGSLLLELNSKADLSPTEKRNVQLSLEDYNRNKKLIKEEPVSVIYNRRWNTDRILLKSDTAEKNILLLF